MVMDFSVLRGEALSRVEELYDHRLLLERDDPLLDSPDVRGLPGLLITDFPPTVERLAGEIRSLVEGCLRGRAGVSRVRVRETEGCHAEC